MICSVSDQCQQVDAGSNLCPFILLDVSNSQVCVNGKRQRGYGIRGKAVVLHRGYSEGVA